MIKAVILVGGPSKGTRFRPLSFEVPKPLFPVAGKPMIEHHVAACATVPGLREVLLLGFYEETVLSSFIRSTETKYNLQIRYLHEPTLMGTAGGFYHFRDIIMEGSPRMILVLHCDIACSFPLQQIVDFHEKRATCCDGFTLMGTHVKHSEAMRYGGIVAESDSIVHYVEKPESFVSDLINCGVYCLSPKIMDEIASVKHALDDQVNEPPSPLPSILYQFAKVRENIMFEQSIFEKLAGSGRLFVYETKDFWKQIKSPGSALQSSALYLKQYRKLNLPILATSRETGPEIVGDVVIGHNSTVHPTAKIGPNVSIGNNVQIAAGVRIANAILLDGVTINERACIMNSIIGWNSTVGAWCRVEGNTHDDDITIFGNDVSVQPEVCVRNCTVLPHKILTYNVHNAILL